MYKICMFQSDDNFLELPDLRANCSYNVTALAVHGDGSYSFIAKDLKFATLKRGYQPSKMGAVTLGGFDAQAGDLQHISAEIEWQPSAGWVSTKDGPIRI